ncbi:hypothetical protein SAMN05216350_103100 [Polaromonas sp. YR568]|uniref:hypothetical protein n=1 Tax=Polaromonas sp. YR568 TaxID=1855301 RepID=UPI0008EE18A0|nr:hypothetical protein [Polaromonas sp. YR568]SFU60781.1 hypothetical protein SAMN05216350_103100 [Polaromonas sp. YR568]
MDKAYFAWILLIAGGAVAGLFVRPRTLLICAVAAFAIAGAGLAVGAMQNNENLVVLSGLALMMVPVGGGLIVLGAGLTGEARRIVAKRKKQQESEE